MLPQQAVILLMDADGVANELGVAARRVHPGVQVLDGALAVAAQLELVGIAAEACLADVEDVLPGVRALRAPVGNDHLGDAGAVADQAAVEADVAQDGPLPEAEADVQLPLVPLEQAVLQREGHALGLRDHQGLEGEAPKKLLVLLCSVVYRVLGHGRHETVNDLHDCAGEPVIDDVEALHWVCVVVIRLEEPLPEVAQHRGAALDLVCGHARRRANRPWLDVEVLLIHLEPSLGQGSGQLLGLAQRLPESDDVLGRNHGPHSRDLLPMHDLGCRHVHVRTVGAQRISFEAHGASHALPRRAGGPLAHLLLGRLEHLDRVEAHVETCMCLDGADDSLDLLRRQRIQGVRHCHIWQLRRVLTLGFGW
mmetsp:Transcript_11676/g.36417  ORF Transcript_11676/g.36417 Transcript_11676/m.36417 type:complete len:366 (-) Transcript_11676:124-1221(-)